MSNLVLQKMTTEEAQTWKSRVGGTANQLRVLLFEGYERGAWEALGYANWTDCIKALAEEYGFTERRLWQLHAANQSEKLLNHGSVGEFPERTLRPLTSLPTEHQATVWQKAVETAPNGKPTAAHVEATLRAAMPQNAKPVTLTPPMATDILAPKPAGEVVRSETRFTLAPPIRDDEEFDDMVDEAEGDEGGYDWRDEEDIEEYTPPVKVAPTVKVPEWTPSQIGRRARVEKGFTVHANMKTDVALIEWAKQTGRFARVDRATEWGNPFHLPDDGDRETVIANYEWYMQKKPSLMKKIGTLKGKVLGCWCHPEPCHAGFLEDLTNDDFFVHSEVKDEGDQVGDADKFYQSENDLENY